MIARTRAEREANMQDILRSRKAPGAIVRGITAFQSTVDGSIITNKSELDAHNKRNDVIDVREWGNDSFCDLDVKREREAVMAGTSQKEKRARKVSIHESIQKLEQGYKPPPLQEEGDI